MSWEGLAGHGVTRSESPYESRRFGMRVARIVVGHGVRDAADVADDLARLIGQSGGDDLIVVRYPSELSRLGAVLAASGRPVLPADVLTYWEVPSANAPEADPELVTIVSDEHSEQTEALLIDVVRDSFAGYGNHYTANPALDPELALAGYLEWAGRAYRANPRNVALLQHGDDVVGVATLTASETDLEIELAGLTAAAQGKGWYGALLAGVRREAVHRGLERVIISTQVSNVRVQRAWVRAGFKPFGAVTTCHLTRA